MDVQTKSNTLDYYHEYAEGAAKRYEQVDSKLFLRELPIWVPSKAKILDLGCGSGRDAAFLLSEEYDVYGIDGSQEMVQEALKLHPELSGRIQAQVLPSRLPFPDDSFNAVISIAFFMHFSKEDIDLLCREIRRVLVPHGVFWMSTRLPVAPKHAEIEERSYVDEHGRFILRLSTEEWRKQVEKFGFYCKKLYMDRDALGREWAWGRFAFLKDDKN
ncbi:MAG: class I SAM-dependent methyltransferase [Spirochaetota bacterium]